MMFRKHIAVLVLLGFSSTCRGDVEQVARFQKEYPPAAARLREQFATVKGSCLLRRTMAKKTKPKRPAEADFAVDQGREKVEIRSYSLLDATRTSPTDPHYTYVYSLCAAEKTLHYLVKAPGAKEFKVQGRELEPDELSTYVEMFAKYTRANTGLLGSSMSEIMSGPGFRIIDAERVAKDGRDLLKVDFEIGPGETKLKASLVFDPDEGWIVRSGEYGAGLNDPYRISFDIAYGPPRDGVSLPRLVTFRNLDGDQSCEFLDWRFEATPREEFQLSHYGLPDVPATGKNRSYAITYWLAGAAVAGLVIALVLRRIANRR